MDYREKSFERFFRAHYLTMFRQAFFLVENEEDAKDAVSQVFFMLWRNKPQIADKSVDSYLQAAIRNECLHILRKRVLHHKMEGTGDSVDLIPCEEPTETIQQDIQQVLDDNLSETNKRILELHYEKGLTYAETASEMGMSHSVIHKRIQKMLHELRTLFNHHK